MDILKNYSIADLEVLRGRFDGLITSSLRDLNKVHDSERKKYCRKKSADYRKSFYLVEDELSQRTLAVHSELQKGGVEA